MIKKPSKRTLRLSTQESDDLALKLALAASRLVPGTVRGDGLQIPGRKDIDNVKDEIQKQYWVKIAPQTESRPLVALFEKKNQELPPEIKVDIEKMRYTFYLVETTFSSMLPKGMSLLSAQFNLTLKSNIVDPARRIRAISLFPNHKDIQYFNIDLDGGVGIDSGLNFTVPKTGIDLIPYVKIDAKFKAGITIGPLHFPYRKAAIEVTGDSDQNIAWRYNLKSELTGTNMFKSLLILKLPQEATHAQIDASLSVIPYKQKWLLFKEQLPPLIDQIPLPLEIVPL